MIAWFFTGLLLGKVMSDFSLRKVPGCLTSDVYMTRITLFKIRDRKLMINIFHKSDEVRDFHDHPWRFWSFILWRGYVEHTKKGCEMIKPFRLIYRPAWWTHKVTLINGKAVTLVLTGKKIREWGFHTEKGWKHWIQYGKENCGQD